MAVDTPAKIAILGAGPVGLEAALYARFLGYDVVLYESGDLCAHVRRLGHLPLPSAMASHRSSLGLAAIQAHDEQYRPANGSSRLTQQEWFDHYLCPLAATDLLADHLQLRTEVLGVAKEEVHKNELYDDDERGDWPFRILLRDSSGAERIDEADVVIDATGVLGNPNWLGHGGLPALGERELLSAIAYAPPDLFGSERAKYADCTTLLVGDCAADVLARAWLQLLELSPHTRLIWLTRSQLSGELQEAMQLALSNRSIELAHGTTVAALRRTANGAGFTVDLMGDRVGPIHCDRIVASVGHRPDYSFLSELQLRICPTTDRPLPAKLQTATNDPLRLVQPEPNFYTLGAKSCGRSEGFTFGEGLAQIRDLFTILGDRPSLNLYEPPARL